MKHFRGKKNPTRPATEAALAVLLVTWLLVFLMPGLIAAPGTRADLAGRIEAVLQEHGLGRAFFGAKVVSLETDEVLFARNPSSFFMPASNMKLVTAVAAAEILGLDYRFRTVLATNGRISDGNLQGDVIVIGSGDPTIGARLTSPDLEKIDEGDPFSTFRQWTEQLKRRGISRITGDLVADSSIFGGPERGAGWGWDDLAWGYAAPVSGVQFNENTALLTVRKPVKAASAAVPGVELSPPDAVPLVNLLRYASEQDKPQVDATLLTPGVIELSGKARTERNSLYRLAIPSPPDYFLDMLRRVLAGSGIAVEGQTRETRASERRAQPLDTLLIWDSPDLRYVLRVMLKVSQNLYAETLLKLLSPYSHGKTFEDGKDQVGQFLEAIGVSKDGFVLVDGSGLSRYNLLTPETLVMLLVHAYRAPYGPEFLGCLPIGGVDGTLRERMRASTAEGNTRAKTGSLMHVRCLSGYVKTKDGVTLAFSLMLNHAPRQLTEHPETVLDEIAGLLTELSCREM